MRDDVRDAVMAMLMDGRLAPGKSVGIDQLARDLGVSPTPVREALVEIEGTGLVQRVAHRGYQVTPPMTRDQTAELAEARMAVEPAAVALAGNRGDADLLPRLRAAHHAHEDAARGVHEWDGVTKDRNGLPLPLVPYYTADWTFHMTILDHCGNRYLKLMVSTLGVSVQRMRQSIGSGVLDADEAVAEHARILAALEAGDTEGAAEAMRLHLAGVRDRSVAEA
ncbi:GntR family transcriptional regulator [Cellulomonas sp. WB94]|nr:GntR family transcriptional regulator [Cellulomonas sp. WB94]